jgi:prevent-host-death family protein
MRKVAAGKFKTHCLAIMDEVQAKRESVIITKRGKPIAKLSPIEKQPDDIFGFMKGEVVVLSDIVSPLPPEDWGDLA